MTAQRAPVEGRRQTGSVADFVRSDSPTAGIQDAIDAIGENGGVVIIPPGEYLLRRAIRVRSHVTLQGTGKGTVLRKVAQVGSQLAAPVDAESRSVYLQNTAGFHKGDEMGIFDRTTVGWLHALSPSRYADRQFLPMQDFGLKPLPLPSIEWRGLVPASKFSCGPIDRTSTGVCRNMSAKPKPTATPKTL